MSIFNLIAAFGGGAFAASIGALPAFIMTGVFAVVGAAVSMAGAADAGNILVNYFAFGSFFGPHIAFAGGVAAAAYAKKKGISDNGADIATSCAGHNAPDVLIVGGIFGVIGFLFKEFVVMNLFAGTISPRLVTDAPGITVFLSAILVRLVFGGKLRTGDKTISQGGALGNTIVIGICYSLLVAGVYFAGLEVVPIETFAGSYHVLIFGMAAIGLVFAEIGQPFFGCHHIVIIAAETAVQCYNNTGNAWMAVIMAIVFGTISAIICDVETNLINSGSDSHIDGPACAIFIMTFVVNACFPA
ncbi:MAG TPA: hypothetical protein H9880_12270 [Candidatus Anaerobutyricum avicola]|nr:hypothetical protein [Candidatus Anaerobutyricum avicola]